MLEDDHESRPRCPHAALGLAPVHADEAARADADGGCIAWRWSVAIRLRGSPLPGRDQLLVGQPVRPRESPHQRGDRRSTRTARTCDPGRLHARAGGGAFRTPVGLDRWAAWTLLLRLRRL